MCIRDRKYKILAIGKVIDALFLNGVSIALGYLSFGVWGLVIGMVIGRLSSILYIFAKQSDMRSSFSMIDIETIKDMAKRYISFPMHSVAATLTGSLSSNIHLFLFLTLYGEAVVGIIALATRLLLTPLGIISTSISQVLYERFSREKNYQILRQEYLKSIGYLTALSTVMIGFVWVLPSNTIGFIFGTEWNDALICIQILVFWFAAQFISGTLSIMYTRLEKESWTFFIQLFNLTLSTAAIFVAYSSSMDVINALILFTVAKGVLYGLVLIFPVTLMRRYA